MHGLPIGKRQRAGKRETYANAGERARASRYRDAMMRERNTGLLHRFAHHRRKTLSWPRVIVCMVMASFTVADNGDGARVNAVSMPSTITIMRLAPHHLLDRFTSGT